MAAFARPVEGYPQGVSWFYMDRYDDSCVGATWVLWSELAAIDWDEEGDGFIENESPFVYAESGPGRRLERRRDYLNGGWATLFELMAVLAKQFGVENVRLAVWFDQW